MNHFYQTFAIVSIASSTVLNQIGRLYIPNSGFEGAENVAIVNEAKRIFTADGMNLGLNVIKFELSNDYSSVSMVYEDTIFFSYQDFIDFGEANTTNSTIDDVTSVDYSPKGYILACIVPTDYFMANGWLAFVNPINLELLHLVELDGCYLPDHVTTTKNGDLIIVACEGEPDDNESGNPTYNPPGSITIVDVSASIDDIHDKSKWTVENIKFDEYNVGNSKNSFLPKDIYLPHSNATVAENIEPEYTSCDYRGKHCYVVLQENNAVAVLDLDFMEIVAIYTLGKKDFSEYGLDASDKDGKININTYEGLYGLRMPDNIKYFQSESGKEYFVTANEGDSKDFDESRVGDADIILNESVFGNVTMLKNNNVLGRLKVINQLGYVMNGSDKIYNELYAFSSRDFTIFKVDSETVPTISEVFSSNSDFEIITANELGQSGFNSDGYSPSFDKRSDDKGPEPECVMVGKCNNGRQYVFIGLERVGGIMVYDITYIDDGNATFVEYENNRNFTISVPKDTRPSQEAGDIGPEQIRFIDEHVYGVPLLVVASAESASITIYRIDCQEMDMSSTTQQPSRPSVILSTIIGSSTTNEKDNANTIKHIISSILIIAIVLVVY